MKNVIAIACGLIKGKNIGENARAAIITRGMSEIVKLGMKMGAKRNTFLRIIRNWRPHTYLHFHEIQKYKFRLSNSKR